MKTDIKAPYKLYSNGLTEYESPINIALIEALENLLESIPSQDNDHDWWPDELTRAVKESNKLLDSIQ